MGFHFSNYGTDEQEEEQEEEVPEKKSTVQTPREVTAVVSEDVVMAALKKYWPKEYEEFNHEVAKRIDEIRYQVADFKAEMREMLKVKDETLVDVWNEVWPSLQKMWKRGVFRQRLEKINQLIIDKIS
jgi:hypothetical protein